MLYLHRRGVNEPLKKSCEILQLRKRGNAPMTVMEVFTLLLVLFAGGTFLLTTISFVIKVLNHEDKKRK